MDYTLRDLEKWDIEISAIAKEMGLDFFPQEFEVCDQYQMLGYLAYNGMPAHYPHWSFGKSFERQKTLYDHGISSLPYEMVINSNPALAYLMKDNSLALQILTMAHVYGHNDFFKNNTVFRFSRPEYTLEMFKAHADRIREYIEDPSIGLEKVEAILDAAHALSLQCRRHLGVKKIHPDEQKQRIMEEYYRARTRARVSGEDEPSPPDLRKVPLEPEEEVLFFLRDNSPRLAEWQKDILTIVAEETQYFIPQMETKIINEGWATFCHYKIIHALELPQGLHMACLVSHNQVIRPIPGGMNPYHVGFKIFEAIEKEGGKGNYKSLLQAREVCGDISFLRHYLNQKTMAELGLFAHEKHSSDRVVTHTSKDEEGWKKIKNILTKNVGLASLPVIKITDVNHQGKQTLYLLHEFDGRELELSYAEKTLVHLEELWQNPVVLESKNQEGKSLFLSYNGKNAVKITYNLLS